MTAQQKTWTYCRPDYQLINYWYWEGWDDAMRGVNEAEKTNNLIFILAYKLGQINNIVGEDIRDVDYLPSESISGAVLDSASALRRRFGTTHKIK